MFLQFSLLTNNSTNTYNFVLCCNTNYKVQNLPTKYNYNIDTI